MTALSRIVRATNWRYAVGEVSLIFVGIILALAANAWYVNHRERNDEIETLAQFRSALEVDLSKIESDLTILRQMEDDINLLIEHMESDEPFSRDLIPKINSVRRWVGIRSMTAPYEALKSRGLDLISDSSLRMNFVYYYETQFPKVRDTYLNDRNFVVSRIGPFMEDNFRAESPTDFLPIDYQALRSSHKFRILCMGKLLRLRNRVFTYYEDTIVMIRQLTQQIDEHSSNL